MQSSCDNFVPPSVMQRYLISYEFNDGEDQETGGDG